MMSAHIAQTLLSSKLSSWLSRANWMNWLRRAKEKHFYGVFFFLSGDKWLMERKEESQHKTMIEENHRLPLS